MSGPIAHRLDCVGSSIAVNCAPIVSKQMASSFACNLHKCIEVSLGFSRATEIELCKDERAS